jgi:hypothetical protein
MHDRANGRRRIPIPRTTVNRLSAYSAWRNASWSLRATSSSSLDQVLRDLLTLYHGKWKKLRIGCFPRKGTSQLW